MFTLHSRKHYLADILDGYRDIHCHLLPGVDDGCADEERSAKLLGRMESLGVKGLYMTPHIINGAYGSRSEADMREKFAAYDNRTKVEVRLAAEYFIDDRFLEHVASSPLAMKDNHLLCEFSLNTYSLNGLDLLFEASLAGYEIIIAHPERYRFLQEAPEGEAAEDIMRRKLQLNLLSLTGFHGTSARRTAEKLLAAGAYTFVGTDTHTSAYLDVLEATKVSRRTFEAVAALRDNNAALF